MAAGEAEGGGATGASVFAEELGVLDKEQARMMAEECILVDRNDVPTGSASKVIAVESVGAFGNIFFFFYCVLV